MPALHAPTSDPLDLVLHIGSGKTGTSSIQYLLHQNRARMADLGVLYPQTPGKTRHTRFGLSIKPDDELRDSLGAGSNTSSPVAFRGNVHRQLLAEINASGLSRVLISDEALYGSSNKALRRLSRFLDQVARSVRLVVYLRRQDDHVVSRYQQVVKVGETRRLVERMQQLDLSKTYDYYARLRTWERLAEPTEFVVRRFERNSFVDGSLYQDFFEAAGIDALPHELDPVESRNESLDAEAVEFLRIVNILRTQSPEVAGNLLANDVMVSRLAEASTGPTLTAPSSVLDPFMAQWEESNKQVAREFLGDDSGELFRVPRKTSNTTTHQHLDPDKLEHFLALLEIPEVAHAPLRAVVEREAKTQPRDDRAQGGGQPGNRPPARAERKPLPAHYDSESKAVIERVSPRTMTQPEKLFGLILATRYVVRHRIPGDVVECGVWRGGSMQAAALTLLESGDTSRDLHLYDTFEGMTSPEEVDRRVDGKSAAELLASSDRDSRVWGVATLADVKAGMAEVGYPAERVHFHPGRVEDTLPLEAPDHVAVLRLDTDWYASTRHELEHLYDRLSPGGVLIIDDYGYWEGSHRATEEFLARSGARLLLLPSADGRIAVKPGL